MDLSAQFPGHVASALLSTFVAGLWQGTALMLLAGALLRLMPRASAAVRHTLLVVSFVAAFLLPWIRTRSSTVSTPSAHAVPVAPMIASLVACVWLAAAAVRAVQLASAWRDLRRVRSSAQPVAFEDLPCLAAGARRAVLCSSDHVESPTVLGFFRPALLLPSWMVPTLTVDELRKIAAHECAHLRRRDDWLNLAFQVAMVLSPLNPALVWLNRRIGVQRELACDAAAIACTGEPIAYASCLARLAEQRLQRRGHLRLALAAWERRSELAQRIHVLLRQPAEWSARRSALAMAIAGAVLLSTSAGLARVPQLVRIAPGSAAQQATVTPAGLVSEPLDRSTTSGGMRMVPASFTMPARPLPARPVPFLHKVKATHRPAHNLTAMRESQRRTLSLYVQQVRSDMRQSAIFTRVMDDAETPVRLVPARFSDPYVAVPLSGGWLLIQL